MHLIHRVSGLLISIIMIALVAAALRPSHAAAQSDANAHYQAAAEYSRKLSGDAVLVYLDGQLVFEEYQNGYEADEPHLLASGSKSFSCAIAVAAIQDGLLNLDELAADTLTEWADDPVRSTITVRQILTLTSGLDGGSDELQGPAVEDKAAYAITQIPMVSAPDAEFHYGPSNFYAFGELMRRKLGGEDVVDYLTRRVLDPIGLEGLEIRRDAAGNPNLPGGILLTAREWAKYGILILNNGQWEGTEVLPADLLQACFGATYANPHYGLTWWLGYTLEEMHQIERLTVVQAPGPVPTTPPQVIMAAGAGKQRLYILPDEGLVVVRLGRQNPAYDDWEFLQRLLGQS